jgi:DNA helicase IV
VAKLADAGLAEALALTARHALVALIVPDELVAQVTHLARRDERVGRLDRDAMTRPVTIVAAPSAKGLEFDAVVVVEPSLVAGSDRRGLRLLYVALTRPIQHLSVVHAAPLPGALAG